MKFSFKKTLFGLSVITLSLSACTENKQTEVPVSVKMVQSEIVRMPNSWMLDFSKNLKWNYCHGLELQAFLDVVDMYPEHQEFLDYAISYADTIINENGNILTYNKERFNIDHVNPAKILFRLYDRTKDEKYKKALDIIRDQLNDHPRTTEGGFWHKQRYPHQMWLDGLYMGAPFYAEYAAKFNRPEDFDDVVNQFALVAKYTYDPATGLYRHAWDESREQKWADPVSGQASHVWGRAVGWYMMAMIDVLDFIPQDHPGRETILNIFQPLSETLLKYQSEKTGAWSQVLDMPEREGNFEEMSCTPMFSYCFLKGVRLGYLDQKFHDAGMKAYNGMLENYVTTDENGNISLTRVCGVAGLGGNPYRDGSFDYYINEIVRDNDPKGVAPFIMTALEVERMNKK